MKNKHQLLLLLLRQSKEDGFSLPFIIGIGLIMLIVGMTMIVRSSDDRVDASAQKGASNSMVAAEVGITRIQNFLNNNRLLTSYNFKSPAAPGTTQTWQTITSLTTTEQQNLFGICNTGGATSATVELQKYTSNSWQTIDSANDPLKGQFLVEDYVYTPKTGINVDTAKTGTILGQGVLTVRGRFNANSNNDTSASLSRIQITIPVTKTPPDSVAFPGIWVGGGQIYANNTIDGDLMVKGCNPDIGGTLTTGHKRIAAPTLDFPTLPPKPGDTAFPSTYTYNNLGILNVSKTLPQVGDNYDTINGVKIYRYLVSSIEIKGSDKVIINSNATQKVLFYVTGNIDVQGSAQLLHQQSGTSGTPPLKPANFQIYGYKPDNNPTTVNSSKTGGDPFICMNGSGTTYGFIYAPTYVAGIAGAGGSTPGFIGSLWIQQWNPGSGSGFAGCGSNTGNTVLTQNIGWDDLKDVESVLGVTLVPKGLPPTLHPIIDWKRLEFN